METGSPVLSLLLNRSYGKFYIKLPFMTLTCKRPWKDSSVVFCGNNSMPCHQLSRLGWRQVCKWMFCFASKSDYFQRGSIIWYMSKRNIQHAWSRRTATRSLANSLSGLPSNPSPCAKQLADGAGEAGSMVGEEVGMGAVAKRVVDGQAVMDTDIGDRNEGREVTSDKEVIHNTDKTAAINLVNC